jgi:MFS family permease
LILLLLGNEGTLGTVTAVVSLIVVILTYMYGRMFNQKHQYKTVTATCMLFFLCAVALAASPGIFSATLYILCMGIAASFFSIAFEPIALYLTEKEMAGDASLRYSFVVDNEIFLNLGRLAAMGIAIAVSVVFAKRELFITPVVVACLQLVFLAWFFKKHDGGKILKRNLA